MAKVPSIEFNVIHKDITEIQLTKFDNSVYVLFDIIEDFNDIYNKDRNELCFILGGIKQRLLIESETIRETINEVRMSYTNTDKIEPPVFDQNQMIGSQEPQF